MQLQAADRITQNSLNKTNLKNMILFQKSYSIYINIVRTFFPQNIRPLPFQKKIDGAYIIYNKFCEVLKSKLLTKCSKYKVQPDYHNTD